MLIKYFVCFVFGTVALSNPIEENGNQNLNRVARSPTFKKKGPLAILFGGLNGGGTGGGYENHGSGYGSHSGVNNYININNYGSHQISHPQTVHHPHQTVDYGHGGSYAGSAAVAGGHGGSQSQSQSASFSVGPYSGSFSQSQAQSGRGGGYSNFFDY